MANADFIAESGGLTPADITADAALIEAEVGATTVTEVFVGGRIIGLNVDGSDPSTAVSGAATTGTYTEQIPA